MFKNKGLKEIASGSLWGFVGLFLGYLLEYANRIIIGRIFGPSDYGAISLSLAIAIICASLSLLGLQTGVARYIAIHSDKTKKHVVALIIITGLKIIFPVSIIFSIVLLLGRNFLISNFFKSTSVPYIIIPFIFLIPIIALAEYFYSCLRGLKLAKYAVLSKEVIRRSVVLIVLLVIIIFNIKKITLVHFAYFVGFIFYMLISGMLVKKNISLDNKNYFDDFKIKELFLFSLPLLFSIILKKFGGQISTIVVGFFRDTKEVGYLSAALPFSRFVGLPLNVVLFMFLPVMSRYWHKKDHEELKVIFKAICNWLFCISGFIFFVFILHSELIITKSFGISFLPAHSALIILAIGQFFNVLCGPTGAFLLAAGESKKYFIGDFVTLFFTLLLYIYFVPKFGFLGAAYINTIHLIILNIVYLIFVYRIAKLSPFNKNTLFAIFFIIVAVLFLKRFFANVSSLGIRVFLTIVVYFGIIAATGILKKKSFMTFYGFLKNNLKRE